MPASSLTDPASDVYHQFARLQSMTQWWHWLVLLAVCLAVIVFVAATYHRDALEMARAKRWGLMALRIGAFIGILVFFLDLEKRSRHEIVKTSRAVVLVDTSLSMGIQDGVSLTSTNTSRRVDAVIDEFTEGRLLPDLRQNHDVVVYRFDETEAAVEVASLKKTVASEAAGVSTAAGLDDAISEMRVLFLIAAAILLISLAALLIYLLIGRHGASDGSWSLLVAMVGPLVAAVLFAVGSVRHPEIDFARVLGIRTDQPAIATETPTEPSDVKKGARPLWSDALVPQGRETRLGDAIRQLVRRERDGPLAAIVIVTDGGQNAGIGIEQAIEAAKSAKTPLYTIGLGGAQRPVNVGIVDIEAPARVYPGDSFALNSYLQAFGLSGRSVQVELRSTDASVDEQSALSELEEERTVLLGEDGTMNPLRFQVVPREQGVRNYEVRVVPPEQDSNSRDNQRSAKVQIVERKNQVLLIASGPSREYRFLRDLLYRDRDTDLHVLLQSGLPGMSQESDKLLGEFPSTVEEMFEYDCVVAFDPDWLELGEVAVDLLERWVSEEAGGLVLVAGPVHTPRWASRLRSHSLITTVRGLYPVIFYSRGSATLALGRFASENPWPLEFSRDGSDAEFLWLSDDLTQSSQAWSAFEGVYGYYAVKEPKPGARVYSHFSDPSTAIDGKLPIYQAGHFYGAGRVFFQASGEMWRIRSIEDSLFEQYYTKLIRWISQGRLLRDSSRGVLLVDKSRCFLGDHIGVSASLSDAQHRPLSADQVTAVLVDPDGRRSSLVLRRIQDATRDGRFAAQFTATREGDYRVELQPPHGDSDELLTRDVRSRIPALETERPERNDPLLKELADQTGGKYYVGFDEAINGVVDGVPKLFDLLQPQDQVSFVAGAPDKTFERVLMTWLLGIICGALCVEWLVRRLSRLA
jgi:hypothetical protein